MNKLKYIIFSFLFLWLSTEIFGMNGKIISSADSSNVSEEPKSSRTAAQRRRLRRNGSGSGKKHKKDKKIKSAPPTRKDCSLLDKTESLDEGYSSEPDSPRADLGDRVFFGRGSTFQPRTLFVDNEGSDDTHDENKEEENISESDSSSLDQVTVIKNKIHVDGSGSDNDDDTEAANSSVEEASDFSSDDDDSETKQIASVVTSRIASAPDHPSEGELSESEDERGSEDKEEAPQPRSSQPDSVDSSTHVEDESTDSDADSTVGPKKRLSTIKASVLAVTGMGVIGALVYRWLKDSSIFFRKQSENESELKKE